MLETIGFIKFCLGNYGAAENKYLADIPFDGSNSPKPNCLWMFFIKLNLFAPNGLLPLNKEIKLEQIPHYWVCVNHKRK